MTKPKKTSSKRGVRKPFSGYDFDNTETRKRMKYLVVVDGDLDINGAYAFKSAEELSSYLKNPYKNVLCVFKIVDITLTKKK